MNPISQFSVCKFTNIIKFENPQLIAPRTPDYYAGRNHDASGHHRYSAQKPVFIQGN